MMKTVNRIVMIFVCLLLPLGAGAQDTHWTIDPYAYQYDMTAYVALKTTEGKAITNYNNYEIAAFCAEECRGVATIQTAGSGSDATTYGYLRIRSNQTSGEEITFKVYVKSSKSEMEVENKTMTFKKDDVQGLPSSPIELEIERSITLGDANGDGEIDIFDAVAIVDYYLTGSDQDFSIEAADFNQDGEVDIFDAVAIVDYYLNQ